MTFSSTLPAFAFLIALTPAGFPVQLQPEADAAFNHYIQLTEQRMDKDLSDGRFLTLGRTARTNIATQETRTLENGKEIPVPHGEIHHWTGAVFLPGVTLARARALKQDYDNYKTVYKPDVIDSRLIKRTGDEFEVFLKLSKKQIVSVMYNTNYRVRYYSPDPKKLYLIPIPRKSPNCRIRGTPTRRKSRPARITDTCGGSIHTGGWRRPTAEFMSNARRSRYPATRPVSCSI